MWYMWRVEDVDVSTFDNWRDVASSRKRVGHTCMCKIILLVQGYRFVFGLSFDKKLPYMGVTGEGNGKVRRGKCSESFFWYTMRKSYHRQEANGQDHILKLGDEKGDLGDWIMKQ